MCCSHLPAPRLALCLLAISLPLFLMGCAGGAAPPAGVHAGDPVTEEERAVAKHLQAVTDNIKELEYIEWGPHDLDGSTSWEEDPKNRRLVRLKYRYRTSDQPPLVRDTIFRIDRDLKVVSGMFNAEERDWFNIAKEFKASQRKK